MVKSFIKKYYTVQSMKKIILYSAIALLSVWHAAAFAATGIYTTIESGWAAQTNLPGASDAQIASVQKNNFPAARLGLGYIHDFSSIFGIGFEAGYGYYGKSTYNFRDNTSTIIKTTAVDFLFVAIAHFNQMDIFGKIGGNRNTTTGIIKSNGANDDETVIQAEVAAGLNYNFTQHFAATISYVHAFGSTVTDYSGNWKYPGFNAVLGGLRITFW